MGWLGVDVGTSSTKAVVYTDAGQPTQDLVVQDYGSA